MMPAVKRGDAVAVSAGGEPPALFTSTSSAPKRSTVAAITASTCSGSRTSAAHEQPAVGQVLGLVPAADRDVRTRRRRSARAIPRPMPRHPPVTSTTGSSKRGTRRDRSRGRSVRSDAPSRSTAAGQTERVPVPDKRVTIDDIVAEVHDGMTVGIGGWGSRRKPMALVRALCRSSVQGPHASCRTAARTSACCAGRARSARSCTRSCRSTRSRSSRTSATRARSGAVQHDRARRRHVPPRPAGGGVARAVPADAGAASAPT